MQLTLFASIALLCSSVLAVPHQRRGGDPSLADVAVYVEDVLNNLDVSVLSTKRQELVDVLAVVEDVLNNADIKVLSTRDLVDVDALVADVLNNADIKVLST